MATNKDKKVLNVPHKRAQSDACIDSTECGELRPKGSVPPLRFPEFTGEWKDSSIGAIANVIGGGTPDTTQKQNWNGNILW